MEEIKKLIQDEISKTEMLIQEYEEMTKPVSPNVAIGRISRIDAINNKSVTESSLRQAELKLSKLKIVLSKADGNDFGLCVKCKQEIPIARILIRPESLHCVRCAS